MNVFDLIQFDEETKTLHVKQATSKGYIECQNHGVFDGSYPGSELRRGRVQDGGGISPALTCGCGTQLYLFLLNNEKMTKSRDLKTEVVGSLSEGKWAKMHEQSRRVYGTDGIAPTIHTSGGGGQEPKIKEKYRIRKLTERECFRLQGVEDADIDKIQAANISKTQQYKMAGNSIVVDVLYHIFRKMFVETKADGGVQLEMF